ncbi:MAG: hypothetical protein OXT74_17455, partial [Candidatus Poribacteria bacterium]|nr:hypothetical protein [Candidatus Poribacteria bacterium]
VRPPSDPKLVDSRVILVPVASGVKYRAKAYVNVQAFKRTSDEDFPQPRSMRDELKSAEYQN